MGWLLKLSKDHKCNYPMFEVTKSMSVGSIWRCDECDQAYMFGRVFIVRWRDAWWKISNDVAASLISLYGPQPLPPIPTRRLRWPVF